jgi:hypothetical protein
MQAGGERDNKRGGGRREEKGYTSARNLGGYCWLHGWDPVGAKHSSRSCTRTRDGHKKEATGDNKMGGSTWQPKDSHYNKLQLTLRVKRE